MTASNRDVGQRDLRAAPDMQQQLAARIWEVVMSLPHFERSEFSRTDADVLAVGLLLTGVSVPGAAPSREPSEAAFHAARAEVSQLRRHLFGGELDAFPADDAHWTQRILGAAYAIDGVRTVDSVEPEPAPCEHDWQPASTSREVCNKCGATRITDLMGALKERLRRPTSSTDGGDK